VTQIDLSFDLYPKQMLALTTSAQLTLYGGAAGGGKSHLARIAAIYAALQYPGLQVYLFRRHYNDLVLNHMNGPTGFRELLFDLTQSGTCKIVDDQIRFYNGRNKTLGSTIHLCHCQYDSDVEKYRGAEIHYFIPEETTQFSETQLRFLLSRVRIPDTLGIPDSERHKWPRVLMPTNPGGLSHSFIKNSFIDGKEELKIWRQPEMDGGRTCIFIPAKLSDNPSIDPVQYRMALMGLKRPELIDAMLNGSWDIPLGAFFPEADERIHRLPVFEIPQHWFKFRTYDWGSGAPFCVQWWTVSDGTLPHIPRGALVCYREWYGCSPMDTKVGLGLSNSQVAEGIKQRTPANEIISATITDSKPFQATGMTSRVDLGSTPAKEFASYGVPLQKGVVNPGSRVLGWQQLRSRLIDKMIFFLDNCPHTWRTLTEIQVDPKNVEDCDSSMEDHPVDCVGLAVKAQPLIKDLPKKNEPKFINEAKFDDVINMHLKLKRMRDSGAGR
jgi:hypothetical protein